MAAELGPLAWYPDPYSLCNTEAKTKCTKFQDTLYPKDPNKKYSVKDVIDLVEHLTKCDDCYADYCQWCKSSDNPYWREMQERNKNLLGKSPIQPQKTVV